MDDHQRPASAAALTPEGGSTGINYVAVNGSAPFREFKKSQWSFVFPMAVFFLLWYAAFVLLGAYAHDFMARRVFGNINMGLFQFVTTFVIISVYVM